MESRWIFDSLASGFSKTRLSTHLQRPFQKQDKVSRLQRTKKTPSCVPFATARLTRRLTKIEKQIAHSAASLTGGLRDA